MAKTITVKDAKGNDVQIPEETVVALAKEHAPQPAVGEIVDLAKFTELSKKVELQDARILELSSIAALTAYLEVEAMMKATGRLAHAVDGAEGLEDANEALHAIGVRTELDLEREAEAPARA